jgi:ssDNA thymidine ADP-ribosyltransferase DarT-like protein/HD domain-containing protein
MPIPVSHAHRYIYHFTHIDNLPNILQTGFLCNNHSDFPAEECLSIAESGIQARRAEMVVPCGPGGMVHDYVPLYFGARSPMLLAVVNKKNVDQHEILYFEFPIALIERENVVFTDASANTEIPPSFFTDPADLTNLNWTEIDSLKWGSASDLLRHQRMAEVLVHSHLAPQEAKRVVVWNEHMRKRVQEIVSAASVPFPPIVVADQWDRHYFLKFTEEHERRYSVVTGPRAIASKYSAACQKILENRNKSEKPSFIDMTQLLEKLRADFACLPQTAELVGLKSQNGIHKETVDVHTLHVVNNLKVLKEFKNLSPKNQAIVELAAFLHDIGKGPKARWANNGGLQKVDPDHAVRALPMMVDILTQNVQQIEQHNAETLLKLVCYHDLVGEVLGKGRDEKQIIDVAKNKSELDMLFALGKADATSLVEWWWDEKKAAAVYARCWAAIKARNG